MKTIRNILNKPIINTIVAWLFLLSIFFLPLNLFLNNLLFTVFFILFFLKALFTQSDFINKLLANKAITLLFICPLLLAVVGSFYTSNISGALKDIGKLLPLLFVVPLLITYPTFFKTLQQKMGYALVLGALGAALICWGGAFIDIYQKQRAITDVFSQPYAYHYLSERVGIHTPYLGLFMATAIIFIIQNIFIKPSRRFIKIIVAFLLFLFLCNLLARTAIVALIFGVIGLSIYYRKFLFLGFGVLLAVSLAFLAYQQEHNFLRDRLFKSINIFEEKTIFSKKDDRFTRYQASIEVFKQFPILGPGTAAEDVFRKKQYFYNLDSEAYNDNYNAHNQFLEYLSTYGLLGGLTFILLLIVLFKEAWQTQNPFIVWLVVAFFLSCLSESILERSWGVSYYLLLLIFVYSGSNTKHVKSI